YSQLSNQIKYGIAKGYLSPGEDLPSVRGLASELGINMHTISKAYSMLKDEGIIIINRSKGVKVSDSVLSERDNDYGSVIEKKVTELVAESLCHGVTKEQLMAAMEKKYHEFKGEE
ncbi:MAG: GntR family transcriptional regulator, partial [Clostridia bacterium]|nr:GntR family transcriptional regulator [Clostridia bacterium]